MKLEEGVPHKYESLSQLFRALDLPKPVHPLIGFINIADNELPHEKLREPHVLKFYKISYKANFHGKLKYGQDFYDFDESGMLFACPGQVISGTDNNNNSGEQKGYTLLIHPDFFHTQLLRKLSNMAFFLIQLTKHCTCRTMKSQPSLQF